jgi:glycosyltransferase involved in cell wall biosynthesis
MSYSPRKIRSNVFLPTNDLICFSHLRWTFVYQRPQHIMSRFARYQRVFFIEEAKFGSREKLMIQFIDNVTIVIPHLKHGLTKQEIMERQVVLLNRLMSKMKIEGFCLWYYTPMAIPFTRHLKPELVIYDSMDELTAFKFASRSLAKLEKELFAKADLIFTGGVSLHNRKRHTHTNIHLFPSSVDASHFSKARTKSKQPADQKTIANPRFGFFGVIDERFDLKLLSEISRRKPNWQFIIVGPVVKISLSRLPKRTNITYLGIKKYDDLPRYIAGWDIAFIPFAINKATEFISPTKTPEYLAAGKPVISTPIKDVVTSYGVNNLVTIVATTEEFIEAGEKELKKTSRKRWLKKVDTFLNNTSWEQTWSGMVNHINLTLMKKNNGVGL